MSIKFFSIFFSLLVCGGGLISCATNDPASTTSMATSSLTNNSLYSNTTLWPSDATKRATLPLTKTLVEDIRAVGGEVYQTGSFVTVVIPDDALFEPSSSVFWPGSDKLIVDVAKIIAKFPGENVLITAHTDGIGSELEQAKLTRQQAQLVAILLWQQDDIDLKAFERFKYAGLAGTNPITTDPSAHGHALNRRIQVTIFPSQEMTEAYHRLGNPDINQI